MVLDTSASAKKEGNEENESQHQRGLCESKQIAIKPA